MKPAPRSRKKSRCGHAQPARRRVEAPLGESGQRHSKEAARHARAPGPRAAAPIELSTTEERIVARARLGSPEQLGAHTPRPRAPSDSWLSVQIHQSALNNGLEQLKLDGRQFDLPSLFKYLAERLDRPEIAKADDVPDDVRMKFAAKDAVRLKCDGDRVEVTFAFAELTDAPNRSRRLHRPHHVSPRARRSRSALRPRRHDPSRWAERPRKAEYRAACHFQPRAVEESRHQPAQQGHDRRRPFGRARNHAVRRRGRLDRAGLQPTSRTEPVGARNRNSSDSGRKSPRVRLRRAGRYGLAIHPKMNRDRDDEQSSSRDDKRAPQ